MSRSRVNTNARLIGWVLNEDLIVGEFRDGEEDFKVKGGRQNVELGYCFI